MAGMSLLRSYFDPEEALVARSFLQSEGYAAEFGNAGHLTVEPMLRLALGGAHLYVPASEFSAANELLSGAEMSARKRECMIFEECAVCGGRAFRRRRSPVWTIIAAAWGVPFVAYSGSLRCLGCGTARREAQPGAATRVAMVLITLPALVVMFIAWSRA